MIDNEKNMNIKNFDSGVPLLFLVESDIING
jgi:hypothetical protein